MSSEIIPKKWPKMTENQGGKVYGLKIVYIQF